MSCLRLGLCCAPLPPQSSRFLSKGLPGFEIYKKLLLSGDLPSMPHCRDTDWDCWAKEVFDQKVYRRALKKDGLREGRTGLRALLGIPGFGNQLRRLLARMLCCFCFCKLLQGMLRSQAVVITTSTQSPFKPETVDVSCTPCVGNEMRLRRGLARTQGCDDFLLWKFLLFCYGGRGVGDSYKPHTCVLRSVDISKSQLSSRNLQQQPCSQNTRSSQAWSLCLQD